MSTKLPQPEFFTVRSVRWSWNQRTLRIVIREGNTTGQFGVLLYQEQNVSAKEDEQGDR